MDKKCKLTENASTDLSYKKCFFFNYYFEHSLINLEQKITFPKLLVDVGHLGNPQGFVKLVILSLEPRTLEGNEPKINIFQVFDQNREVIAEMQELQGALNLLQVAQGYQVHLGKQDVKKKPGHIWALSKSP